MDNVPLDRAWLESLSTGELCVLAERYGIDMPPDPERTFIIEELLDFTSDPWSADLESAADQSDLGLRFDDDDPGNGDAELSPLGESDSPESSPLPKQYNITFIDFLIRDPLWAFVFWEFNCNDKIQFEKDPGFGGYFLRVTPAEGNVGKGESFTVTVGSDDHAWYLGFPPSGGRYTVALCALRGEEETVLARSRPFRMPGLYQMPDETSANPLIQLSGAEDFQVFRHGDRLSRCKTT
ncbi:DUF4912 domain-containing protein [Spirochaetia bacterium]|nr:DUF4912 domain-containing protein [Spirochaetia bacterium]